MPVTTKPPVGKALTLLGVTVEKEVVSGNDAEGVAVTVDRAGVEMTVVADRAGVEVATMVLPTFKVEVTTVERAGVELTTVVTSPPTAAALTDVSAARARAAMKDFMVGVVGRLKEN